MTTGEAASSSSAMLGAARRAFGITGAARDPLPPVAAAARDCGIGLYPVAALSLLLVTLEFRQSAVLVFAPEISDDLGISRATTGALGALGLVVAMSASLAVAVLAQRGRSRARMVLASALLWSAATLAASAVSNAWQLAAVTVLYGLGSASVLALHAPLLVESYPPGLRGRILSAYHGARSAANVVVPLLIALLASVLGLGWRAVLAVLGVLSLVLILPTLRLRDPVPGGWDVARVRELVGGAGRDTPPATPRVERGLVEVAAHLAAVPTVRRLLAANVGIGMTFVPLGTYLLFFLRDEWGLTPGQRSVFFGLTPLAAIVALALFGPVAERMFRADPRRLLRLSAAIFAGGVVAVAVAVLTPLFPAVAVGIAVGLAAITMVGPAVQLVAFSVVPPEMRPHYAAFSGLLVAGVGGFAGLLVLGSLEDHLGNRSAIVALTVPACAAAIVAARAGDTVQQDVDRLLLEILDEEQTRGRVDVPLLQCDRLVVQHAGLRVLHGLDVSVDAGEVVALIGTNGAGKTTLLECVSGLRPPDSGTVRLAGRTVTYLPAERRVGIGIVHIPPEGAVFGALTARENLELARAAARRGAAPSTVDEALEQLPELVPLLDRPAGALSGGEQRLVALGRALVLRPRLLLVDELALGLAPALVQRTADVVRALAGRGVGVLVAEQSVDLALSLADRVYVLDAGALRYGGRPEELPGRLDLVRATFLGGAPGDVR